MDFFPDPNRPASSEASEHSSRARQRGSVHHYIRIHPPPPLMPRALGTESTPPRLPSPSTTLSQRSARMRLSHIHSMLRGAMMALDRMENATHQSSSTTSAATNSTVTTEISSSTHAHSTFNQMPPLMTSSTLPTSPPNLPLGAMPVSRSSNFVLPVGSIQIATTTDTSSFAGDVSAGRSQSTAGATQGATSSTMTCNQQQRNDGQQNSVTPHSRTSTSSVLSSGQAMHDGVPASVVTPSVTSSSQSSSRTQQTHQRDQTQRAVTGPTQLSDLADAMAMFLSVSSRMVPHWTTVNVFLREDPALEDLDGGDAALRRHQTDINLLSNAMHFLSHAQHALSDLFVNCRQHPPRDVRARVRQPHPFSYPVGNVAHSVIPFPMRFAGGRHFVVQPMQQRPRMPAPSLPSASGSQSSSPTQMIASTSSSLTSAPGSSRLVNSSVEMEVALAPVVVGTEGTENSPAGNRLQQQPSPIASGSLRTNAMNEGSGTNENSGMAELTEDAINSMQEQLSRRPATTTDGLPASRTMRPATTTSCAGRDTSGHDAASTQTPRISTSTSTTHIHYPDVPLIPPRPIPLLPRVAVLPAASSARRGTGFDPFLPCTSHHLPTPFTVRRQSRGSARVQEQHSRSSSAPPSRSSGAGGATATGLTRARASHSHISEAGASGSPALGSGQRVLNTRDIIQQEENSRQEIRPPQLRQPRLHGQPSWAVTLDPDLLGLFQQLTQGQQLGRVRPEETNVLGLTGDIDAMSGGNGGDSITVSQFLSQMPDYSYVEGQNMFTDLLMTVAGHLTFGDMIQLLSGCPVGLPQLRLPLRRFILTRIMHQHPVEDTEPSPSSEELEAAMLAFTDDMFPKMEAMAATANVREGIDFAETLHSFFTANLTTLALCIFRTSRNEFSGAFRTRLHQACNRFVVLCNHCFLDSQTSLEQLLQNHLPLISGAIGRTVQQWTMSSAIRHLRRYVIGVSNPESEIAGFLVGIEKGASRRVRRNKKRVATSGREENFAPARSPLKLMETEEQQPAATSSRPTKEAVDIEKKSTEGVVPFMIPPPVDETFPPSLLSCRSDTRTDDMVVGSEPWHQALPPEWVPIVARDVQAQRKHDKSDDDASNAYLVTQPAKRCKLSAEAKPPSGIVTALVTECLQEAVLSAGIIQQPSTSQSSGWLIARDVMGKDAQRNDLLRQAAEATALETIKKRLEQEPNFDEKRYPSSKAFLENC